MIRINVVTARALYIHIYMYAHCTVYTVPYDVPCDGNICSLFLSISVLHTVYNCTVQAKYGTRWTWLKWVQIARYDMVYIWMVLFSSSISDRFTYINMYILFAWHIQHLKMLTTYAAHVHDTEIKSKNWREKL